MKKRLTCFFLTVLMGSFSLGAEDFLDNEFQKAGREYEAQAASALDAGDYEKAAELAAKASAEYKKSREYADIRLQKVRAANAISLADQEIKAAEPGLKDALSKDELNKAKILLTQARDRYDAQDWLSSRSKALEALEQVRSIIKRKGAASKVPVPDDAKTLPRYYVVTWKSLPQDCFWNIAALPQVYGNPRLWPALYQANKHKLRYPANPDYILPGMVIEIPPLNGEKREGFYKR